MNRQNKEEDTMADVATTKKVTDLAENTDITDEDLFIAGSAGTASLRKVKWSNVWAKIMASILNKISANNLITTTAGYLLDARQGKALDAKISELNTNRLKVKTKVYRVEVTFDSNIGKYEGHIVNTDFLKDFPEGTIVATLVTGHDMHGYGMHNATWSIFDNNLIANATMAGTYNATVTWLYL